MTKEKVPKKAFVQGAISANFIGESIAKHSNKDNIGAHSIFLGQVRADEKVGGKVVSIFYEAYEEMAEKKIHEIREDAFAKFDLICMHIYHSLGTVNTGEMSLFIFTSSAHRLAAAEACSYIVERIKAEVQVWGKEILDTGSIKWKENT